MNLSNCLKIASVRSEFRSGSGPCASLIPPFFLKKRKDNLHKCYLIRSVAHPPEAVPPGEARGRGGGGAGGPQGQGQGGGGGGGGGQGQGQSRHRLAQRIGQRKGQHGFNLLVLT